MTKRMGRSRTGREHPVITQPPTHRQRNDGTATGILVAVPAVIAYNLLTKRVENFTTDMELVASETGDLLARD